MERNIFIEKLHAVPIEEREVEVVERKGLGHPDTLIDGIMENVSRALCIAYMKEVGKVMHHNVDKGQICGGATSVEFGGGNFLKPIYILLSGRATSEWDERKIPAVEIAMDAAKRFLKENTRNLDVEKDVIIEPRISQGSRDLVDLFLRAPPIPLANDTSFGVGYAPFSDTERLVLETERMLNSRDYKKKNQFVGEDIKVMAVREKDRIKLTVAVAFVSKHVTNLNDYADKKRKIEEDALKNAKKITGKEVELNVNTADDYQRASIYLTLTGLSCEMGDDGSVGRGNRSNGLITPGRPMSLEAAAGKNPVNHVGKIYNVLAGRIANDIVRENPEVAECNVMLLSQIGAPIDRPKNASVEVLMKKGEDMAKIKRRVEDIVDRSLANVTQVTDLIIKGHASVYY